ncbi:MAG: hypothetical protein Q9208_002190 [Pyrenodesmia sp. 3 TL-2023]
MAPPSGNSSKPAGSIDKEHRSNTSLLAKSTIGPDTPSRQLNGELRNAMAELNVKDEKMALKSTGSSELSSATRPGLRFDDEQTHISASSTKPASLDGKSTTSGMTFAMDEKESLRPDDSASVKAAEEEDSCSGTGSGAPNSRVGSEAGGRAFRDQFYEISERIGHVPGRSAVAAHRGIPGIEEEAAQAAISPLQTPLPAPVSLAGPGVVPAPGSDFQIEYRSPDEKLLEALQSSKDRLFVLRLEQDIINFIQNSREQTLDLRTPNSFCRLLAHKLADYYALTHHVDAAMSAVKLYRTPYCRMRNPLSAYPQVNPNNDNSASMLPAVKIMRRAGLGKGGHRVDSGPNTTESSMAPSKAGSEAGDDSGRGTGLVSPTESNPGKDRAAMTREEREAKYKETRDRIFKGFEDVEGADPAASNEAAPGISRTSSTNGKRKSRKQRNADDGFEARSHYTAYYPSMPFVGPSFGSTPVSPAYFNPGVPQHYPTMGDSSGMVPGMYPPLFGPGYSPMPNTPVYPSPAQQYPTTSSPTSNGFSNMQPFPSYIQQVPLQYYPQPQSSPALGHRSPVISSPLLGSTAQLPSPEGQPSQASEQQWPYPYPYQQPTSQQQFYPTQNPPQSSVTSVQTVPYQYGQLPCPPNLPGSRNAHPLPGSYNRQQAFNPQIRSFVPNSAVQPLFIGHTVHDPAVSGQISNTTATPSGPPHVVAATPPVQMSNVPQFGSFVPTSEPKPLIPRKSQNRSDENHAPPMSTLAKWGTPANLPPKPPPLDPPGMPPSLPQSIPAPPSLPKLSSGQSMPTFQNGIYAAAHQ